MTIRVLLSSANRSFLFLVVLGEFDENRRWERTQSTITTKKKRNSKKETKRSSIFSFTLPQHLARNVNKSLRFSFSNRALDQLYKKKVKDCEEARVLQRRTTNVLRSRSRAKYVVKKVAPFFLSFYHHSKQSILKSLLLNVEKCQLNREHGYFILFFFRGGGTMLI